MNSQKELERSTNYITQNILKKKKIIKNDEPHINIIKSIDEYRLANGKTNGQTNGQENGQANKQANELVNRQANGQANELVNRLAMLKNQYYILQINYNRKFNNISLEKKIVNILLNLIHYIELKYLNSSIFNRIATVTEEIVPDVFKHNDGISYLDLSTDITKYNIIPFMKKKNIINELLSIFTDEYKFYISDDIILNDKLRYENGILSETEWLEGEEVGCMRLDMIKLDNYEEFITYDEFLMRLKYVIGSLKKYI